MNTGCYHPPCSPEELCQRVANLEKDMATIWDDVYSQQASVYIATGNIGVPFQEANYLSPDDYANDLNEYNKGAALINKLNPKGLIITGDANYDEQYQSLTGPAYSLNRQADKLSGFLSFISRGTLYPVMGDSDFWTVTDQGDMDAAYIRMMPYLPDAKRYYSIYDEQASTEFFFLSYGTSEDWWLHSDTPSEIFPDDTLIGGPQYTWFAQRCSVSPAKNRVVIFHTPIATVYANTPNQGGITTGGTLIRPEFTFWDFDSFGVKLIITGHDGGSFHLRRGNLHVVGSSAFCRSKSGWTDSSNVGGFPPTPSVIGDSGFAVDYFSHFPLESNPTNAHDTFDGSQYYVVPKNEFFRMTCTREGIFCENVSYDPYYYANNHSADNNDVSITMKVEHSFTIPPIS